jgi:hypothetical protein
MCFDKEVEIQEKGKTVMGAPLVGSIATARMLVLSR